MWQSQNDDKNQSEDILSHMWHKKSKLWHTKSFYEMKSLNYYRKSLN